MRLIMLVLVFFFSVLPSEVFSEEYSGKIKGFYINSTNTALVKLDSGQGVPLCGAKDGWHFVFDSKTDSGKQWVSMILASRFSGGDIKVGYTVNPNGYCTVTYFYYYD